MIEGKIEELVPDWCFILSKCLETTPKDRLSPATLLSHLSKLLEIAHWSLPACFPLINSVTSYCDFDVISSIVADLCEILQKTIELSSSAPSIDQSFRLIQCLCHIFTVNSDRSGGLTGIIPWAVDRFERWYSCTSVGSWQLRVTNLYLSLAAYDFQTVAKASKTVGIRLENVINNVSSLISGKIDQFDRKSLVFGLIRVVQQVEDVRLIANALKSIVELYKGVSSTEENMCWEEKRRPEKRGKSQSDEECEETTEWRGGEECYSPVGQMPEKEVIRTGLEELRRERKDVYERVVGAMDATTRLSLVSVLHMDSPDSSKHPPRVYLVPKYSHR